jgi:hypothetical protein
MPRVFYDDDINELVEKTDKLLMINELYEEVKDKEKLKIELDRLEEKYERMKDRANESLERLLNKINKINDCLKLKESLVG